MHEIQYSSPWVRFISEFIEGCHMFYAGVDVVVMLADEPHHHEAASLGRALIQHEES